MDKDQKYRHLFDTEHLNRDLKSCSIRGGGAALLAQASSFVIRMLSMIGERQLYFNIDDNYGLTF